MARCSRPAAPHLARRVVRSFPLELGKIIDKRAVSPMAISRSAMRRFASSFRQGAVIEIAERTEVQQDGVEPLSAWRTGSACARQADQIFSALSSVDRGAKGLPLSTFREGLRPLAAKRAQSRAAQRRAANAYGRLTPIVRHLNLPTSFEFIGTVPMSLGCPGKSGESTMSRVRAMAQHTRHTRQ